MIGISLVDARFLAVSWTWLFPSLAGPRRSDAFSALMIGALANTGPSRRPSSSGACSGGLFRKSVRAAASQQSCWRRLCGRLPEGRDQGDVMQGLFERVLPRDAASCVLIGRLRMRASREFARLWRRAKRLKMIKSLLPLFHQMTFGDQDHVVDGLRRACTR